MNHRKKRRLTKAFTATVMVAVLVLTGCYYNFQQDQRNPNVPSSDRGNTEGSLCFSGQLPVIDGSGDTGATIDPTATGKITVINFWGTWCTPCVAELPYFDQIATEYGDEVCVIAIHSSGQRETAPEYIREHYPDSGLIFAWDSGEMFMSEYYSQLGGRGTYPYTLVLDKDGVITKVFFSSVTYEDLKAAVESSR